MTGALDEARVVDLARRLKGAETGGWSASAVRALAEGIGRGTDGAAGKAAAFRDAAEIPRSGRVPPRLR
ncbi:hypothetical protein [Streptomyces cucumeris]|uniref:hypothetical protein n=1 Tax=Streptomyces cucumeris TaxID=2962890 RepID=UPI003D744623